VRIFLLQQHPGIKHEGHLVYNDIKMGFQTTVWGGAVLVWLRIDPSVLCWGGENYLSNFKRYYKILSS
jgi:hypothetical protein